MRFCRRLFLGRFCRLRCRRGSVLIEASVTLAFSAAAIASGLAVSYASFARFWLSRAAYETSICLSTPAPTSVCEQSLRRTTTRVLPIGTIDSVVLSRTRDEVQTRFQWRMNSDFVLKIHDVEKLPLLGPTKDQSGFGVIGLLVLMPFLMSVLVLISGSALLFKADAHLQHECRVSVLNSQRTIAQTLRKLLALNPQAKELRLERAITEAQLKLALATAQPEAIAAAEADLALVKSRQALLALEQKSLIAYGRLASIKAPVLASSSVVDGLVTEARENRVARPRATTHLRRGTFDVVATPPNDATPGYEPSADFSAKQTVDVNVNVEVASLLPEWLRNLLPTGGLTINTHYQATIKNQENQWTETLSAAR